jgi:hypothetical protein
MTITWCFVVILTPAQESRSILTSAMKVHPKVQRDIYLVLARFQLEREAGAGA